MKIIKKTKNKVLTNKRGRPMVNKAIIVDELTNKIYDPELDPEGYRKARKRIKNRLSALKSRMKKKENDIHFENEFDYL